MSKNVEETDTFMPQNPRARLAVERARAKVKQNNEMIEQIKAQSNVAVNEKSETVFIEAQDFKVEDSHMFELYKIRSNNIVKDFFKGVFGIH